MKKYLDSMSDAKSRRAILRAGALVVRRQAKKFIPKRKNRYVYLYKGNLKVIKKPFFYYRGGEGKTALMFAGNLRNSIYIFRTKRNNYSDKGIFGDIEVGPRVLRKISHGSLIGGTPKTSSGYYASALAGSYLDFRQIYLERAYRTQSQKVEAQMKKALERIHKRLYK